MNRGKYILVALFAMVCISAKGQVGGHYETPAPANTQTVTSASSSRQVSSYIASNDEFTRKRFQGYGYLGVDFNSWSGGPFVDASAGVRFSKYLYVGGGIGWHHLIGRTDIGFGDEYHTTQYWVNSLNYTADLKVYIPTRVKGLYPRFDLSLGAAIGGEYVDCEYYHKPSKDYIAYYDGIGGCLNVGAGLDYRMFSFGIGFQAIALIDIDEYYSGYVRFGVRFGPTK
jgi:hypothetical protein